MRQGPLRDVRIDGERAAPGAGIETGGQRGFHFSYPT
jgi:hypothetical protein